MTGKKDPRNELLNVLNDSGIHQLITTKGSLKLSKDDVGAIDKGYFPSGIKSSPIIEGISLKTIRNELSRALKPPKDSDGKNQATLLWECISSSFFFSDQTGYSYIVHKNIPMAIDNNIFEDFLTNVYYSNYGIIPSTESITQVRKMARFESRKTIQNVGVRSARLPDGIAFDPVSEDGSIFAITDKGINQVIPTKPITIRYNGMEKATVEEGKIEHLKTVLSQWSLDDLQEVLLVGYIGTAFIPDIPHVILVITGPHGAGKSSLSDFIKTVPDPNVVVRNSLRFDEKELATSSMHEWILNFDNVNAIIPDFISDLVCRISTGQGFRKRKLYTDQDDLILKYLRVTVINAINEPGYNPDFLDRSLVFRLGILSISRRKTDAEIKKIIDEYAPKIRGLYLGAIQQALGLYPRILKEYEGKLLRMADFIIWGEAITRILGYEPDSFYKAFVAMQEEETKTTADENLLIMSIEQLLTKQERWEGTTKELYDEIQGIAEEMNVSDSVRKQLPKDYRTLGRKLSDLLPSLFTLGIEIKEDHSDKNKRTKVIKRIEPVVPNENEPGNGEEKQKKLDNPFHENDVGNVGNVGNAEKFASSNTDNTSDKKNDNVGNGDRPLNTPNQKTENTLQSTDSKQINVGDSVGTQNPVESVISDSTDKSDISSSVKEERGNNQNDEENDNEGLQKFGFDYFRIIESFNYSFDKNGKENTVRCKTGDVKKLPMHVAIKQKQLGRIDKACKDGSIWDPLSRQCIMGSNKNE
ncbi:MAG: hypothetical protein M1161_02825 [Candidatus Thermoplasmatota archaeon]|jgi:hypothetical protein|nr:hypothetical protein [Candidatus Thermoplasmatota archaeon]